MKNIVKFISSKVRDPKVIHFLMAFTIVTLSLVSEGHAQTFGTFEKAMTAITGFISGPFGTFVAVAGVIATGFTFMMGKMDWMFAASIIAGIVFIKSAVVFVGTF